MSAASPLRVRRALIAAALGALGVLLVEAPAEAHARLERAEPRAGSALRTPPREVRLYFTQRVEPAYSDAEVRDARGRRVDGTGARVDADQPTLMRVSLPALDPGRYTVRWRVLSVDGHVTTGQITFTVVPK